jgi:hypothetical protein
MSGYQPPFGEYGDDSVQGRYYNYDYFTRVVGRGERSSDGAANLYKLIRKYEDTSTDEGKRRVRGAKLMFRLGRPGLRIAKKLQLTEPEQQMD